MLPINVSEIIFVCLIMIFSLTVFGYNLGEISNLVVAQDEALVKNREIAVAVRIFLDEQKFSSDL